MSEDLTSALRAIGRRLASANDPSSGDDAPLVFEAIHEMKRLHAAHVAATELADARGLENAQMAKRIQELEERLRIITDPGNQPNELGEPTWAFRRIAELEFELGSKAHRSANEPNDKLLKDALERLAAVERKENAQRKLEDAVWSLMQQKGRFNMEPAYLRLEAAYMETVKKNRQAEVSDFSCPKST